MFTISSVALGLTSVAMAASFTGVSSQAQKQRLEVKNNVQSVGVNGSGESAGQDIKAPDLKEIMCCNENNGDCEGLYFDEKGPYCGTTILSPVECDGAQPPCELSEQDK